jgi:pantoate--beta-alanine ligase
MQRQALAWKRAGIKVGFVPTMGYLHEGHISLVHAARKRVGKDGVIVVSIYVNPTQFGPKEDLAKYPRDFPRDSKLCRDAGVDIIFTPNDPEMYAGRDEGTYSTYVVEEILSGGMEGAARPGHFRGVTTIVAKLFNCVLPDVAVFGAKDWQQAAVIRRMTVDLNFPLKVVVAPTRRESDGLAMSSRNSYLSAEERPQAKVVSQSIALARNEVRAAKKPIPAAALKEKIAALIQTRPAARLDYVEFFDPETLRPRAEVGRGTQMALAVFVGKTRLIDNGVI